MKAEWLPTKSNSVCVAGFRAMHGGATGMQLREHEHREAQVEVHFRRPVGSKGLAHLNRQLLPGETRIIPPQCPHVGEWEAGSEVTVFLIPAWGMERAADEILVRHRFSILDQELSRDPLVHQLASSLRDQFHSSIGVSKLFVESSGYLVAEHILRTYAETDPLKPCRDRLDDAQVAKLVRLIDESLEEGLSVAQMARAIDMGPHRFARLLRLVTGRTPHEFVQARRIELAKTMLEDGQMSLAEIALRLGFANQSHFTAVFHKATRITPNVYRRHQGPSRTEKRS
jgi:AraC family transcriptional regulator